MYYKQNYFKRGGGLAKIIRFDDKEFLKMYKEPARPDTEKRARLIYKALEIYYNIKEVKNGNNDNRKNK